MFDFTVFFTDPTVWAALITLIVMEVVLGIDNLIFISILSNKLPPEHARTASPHRHRPGPDHAPGPAGHHRLDRHPDRTGVHLAFRARSAAMASPGSTPPSLARPDPDRRRPVPGLEGHQGNPPQATDPTPRPTTCLDAKDKKVVVINFGAAIVQIILLDLVFSIDSILTAVGMTDHVPIMVIAVVFAVGDAAGRRPAGRIHRQEPDRGHAGPGLPADDRRGADRRRLRRACAQGLHLCRHGLLGRWSRA
jgi:hypothetical protein